MDRGSTILFVTHDRAEEAKVAAVLSDEYGYRVLSATTGEEALRVAATAQVDLIVCEERGPGVDGLSLLSQFRLSHPDVIRVLVADEPRDHLARDIFRDAAIYQYVSRPIQPEQVGLVVERGLETRELARRHRILSRELKFTDDSMFDGSRVATPRTPSHRFEKLVYASERMADLCDIAGHAARTDLPILIQGETGTGKELLARAIHYNSSRSRSPLLVQNCGGLRDELLQSELFGHRRGAFTGAVADRLGLFRAADGGTVFLDEISEVSPAFQVSLLRFLQGGEVKPLGADKAEFCNVRVIAASNRPLRAMVDLKEYRADLYFRLKGFELEVPPLRSRTEDIPALAEFFVRKHGESLNRKLLGIANEVIERLCAYDFPGNVRELENEIRRMVALARDGEYLTVRHLSPAIASQRRRATPRPPLTFTPEGQTLHEKVESLERRLVRDALERNRWNQSRTAEELGLSRVGLANKIKRYSLHQVAG